jgi:pimeloyl-ACP methyl ester carboxylesterase
MKKKNYLERAMLLLCLLASNIMNAKTTGSYDTTITFSGSPRAVSMYVPPTYDPTIKYRLMVCLHGLGDTCNNYRDALVSGLTWPASAPNTIFVCPEAAFRNRDYFYPAGGEAIVQASMDFAFATYHIDTANVVLQGFSLGGEAALRYGLDNYPKFKGLLLNTPALQGVKAAINQTAVNYTYANASHIPIYISHGQSDVLYGPPIDSAYEQMVLNDGLARYYEFPGVGHAIPTALNLSGVLQFFDKPTVAGADLDVVTMSIAQRSCITSLPATCILRNTGDSNIHSFTLDYTFAGTTLHYMWSGTLAPFQHTSVSLPAILSPAGNQTLKISEASMNGSVADTFTYNNSMTAPFQVVTTGISLPIFEGFEGVFPPLNWVQYLAGDAYAPWAADSTTKKTGIASMGAFNSALIFDNTGRKEEIASPVLDLARGRHARLTFDVAYNYDKYTPPYTLTDTVLADTLAILVSVDGGNTYTTVYKKGGAQLATFPNPILNPMSVSAGFIVPALTNWRTDSVDLSLFDTATKAIVKFSYISAYGGSINIDNINIGDTPLGIQDPYIADLQVYPNPASNKINIQCADEITEVTVTDISGRIIHNMHNDHGGNTAEITTASLVDGIYIVKITTTNGSAVRKIEIRK